MADASLTQTEADKLLAIGSPHLHLYREGFGDKWAFPVPPKHFSNLADPWLTLEDFMRFCNVTEPPFIRRGLFT